MDIKKIIEETEVSCIEKTELISKKIIRELEFIFGFEFVYDVPLVCNNLFMNLVYNSKTYYFDLIIDILLKHPNLDCRKVLINLLKDYGLNVKSILFHFLSLISQNDISDKDDFINLISKLPYFKKLDYDDTKIKVKTRYGQITLFRYDLLTNNLELINSIKTKRFVNDCHSAVLHLKQHFKDDYIITSEIPWMFGGYIYHSYFLTENGVVDIANNAFYLEEEFYRIFNPKEILRIKTSDLDERYLDYLDSEVVPILSFALHNKNGLLV